LPAGQRAEFKIRVRGAEKVQLRIGDDQWIPMRQAADGFYAVGAVVPAGSSVKIVANPSSGGNTYWTLADFSK
jgi:hypothetical protein